MRKKFEIDMTVCRERKGKGLRLPVTTGRI